MSTLADELLNDFGDSDSDREDEQQNGFLQDDTAPATNGSRKLPAGAEMDVDEEDESDEDEETLNGNVTDSNTLEAADDEEEAKAKVEKMQLGGVNDVRSVAGLMKTLEPVLEVGLRSCPPRYHYFLEARGLHLPCGHSPDVLRLLRKSHIISRSH